MTAEIITLTTERNNLIRATTKTLKQKHFMMEC